ncbi:hypothetical protein DID77_01935 [Candidatus Marinamargulisbacteria bacterium SCGC AG-439-L15]|nr:hypothetical protein DID77_01935 [Candidatus Marinamargulisbacteria bacterium SCGC AG-439-L15]
MSPTFTKSGLSTVLDELNSLTPGDGVFVARIRVPFEDSCLLQFLEQQVVYPKLYWSARDCSDVSIGIGAALHFVDFHDEDHLEASVSVCQTFLQKEPSLKVFSRLSFETQCMVDDAVQPFMLVPLFEIEKSNQKMDLICNVLLQEGESWALKKKDILSKLNRLVASTPLNWETTPSFISRQDSPAYPQWENCVKTVSSELNRGGVEKVVLARQSRFQFSNSVSPYQLLHHIIEREPNTFHFAFEMTPHKAIIGGTPESLFYRQGVRLFTEAIAGTRPRHVSKIKDVGLAEDLCSTEKDIHEHQFVVEDLVKKLDALCTMVRKDPKRSILKLTFVQHLLVRLEGTLKKSISDMSILKTLHPTPATAGVPLESALSMIKALEPFERNWYASPVGWFSKEESLFVVGIRSAAVLDSQVLLRAGAGIVKGSTPKDEWDEIENKIKLFLTLFGG